MFSGKHLINGNWIVGEITFQSSPTRGTPHTFAIGTPTDVNLACGVAETAFVTFSQTARAQRAAFLDKIADEIESRAGAITAIGCEETGLPEGRLNNERGRTTGQLRLFARHIETADYLDRRHDAALPDRQPPRPDLRLMQRPVGPVAVFGASNFPLAFSVAGGDTASALAAGCPVVVKGHPAHPGTGEIVAQAIDAARRACGLPAGVFSFIQAGNRAAGAALVQHPFIKAVGFTGSLVGGKALFDLCAWRPEPIPFFGELGSINPMFLLPNALNARTAEIGKGWAGSLTMGVGQFCTNPGVVIVQEGTAGDAFVAAAEQALRAVALQTMLADSIAQAYRNGLNRVSSDSGVEQHLTTSTGTQREAAPALFVTSGKHWLEQPELSEEIFGPAGIVIKAHDFDEVIAIAAGLHGQLTCTLHMDPADADYARQLLPILERKAGRILANGYPTGVEVCDAMIHGGPYPASTNFGATSVGTMAIRRFLRPVCYQDIPVQLLPPDLQ